MRNLSDKYESAVVDETEEVYDYESVMAESYIGAQAGIAAYLAQFSDSPIGQLVMSNWTDALTEIVQDTYDGITSQLQKDTSNVLTKLFSTGRGVAPDKLDLIDKRTVSFLHDYNYTSITHMNDDIQNGIKGMVYRGLSAEETPEQIIKKVSTHIKQPMPVYRTADLVKVERGAKNIRDINPLRFLSPKARGMMISRTNPAMSYNRGLLEGYKFDGVRKVYSPHRAGECVSCSTIVSSGPWRVGSVTPPPWHTNCGHNLYPVLDSTKITGDLRSLLNYEDVIPINPPNFNMDFLGAKSPAKELVIETAAKELPDHLRMDHLFSEGVIEWIPDSTKAVYKSPTHFQFGSKLTKEDLRSKFLEFCGYRHWTRYERELTSKGFKRSDFGKAFSEHLTVKGGVKNVDLKPVIEKDVFKVEMKKTPVTASTKEVVKDVGGLGGYLSDTTKIKIIPADLIAQMSPAMQKLTGEMLTEVGENLSKLPSSISEKIVFRYDNKVRGVLSPTGKEIVASTDQGIYRTIANDVLWPALKDSTELNRRDFIAIATDWIDGVFPEGSAQDKLMKSLMDTYSKTVKASPKKLQPDYGSNITKANLRHFYTPSQMYKDNIAMTTKRYDPKLEMRDSVWAFAKDENDLRRRLDYVDDHEVGFIVADDGRLKLITKGEDHRVGIERSTQRLLTADGSMYGHYHPASVGPSQTDLMNQIHNYIQGVNRSPNIVVTRNHIYKNEIKDYNKVKGAFNNIESVKGQLTAARAAYVKEEQRIRSALPWGKEVNTFLAKTNDPDLLEKYYKYVDRLREDNSYLLAQRYGDALGIEITRYKNDTAHTLKEIFEGEIGTANKVITLDDVTNALNLPKSTTKQVEFTPPVVKKAPKPVTKVLPEPKQSNLGPLFEEEHGLQLVDFDKRSAPSLKKGLSYLPDDIKNTLIVARKDMKGAVYDATTETVSGRYMADIVQTIARDVLYPKYGDVSGLNIDEFVKLAGQYFKTTNRDPNSIKLFDKLFQPKVKQLDKTQKKVLPVMISKDTPNFNKENGYITLRTREEADAYYETVSKKMKPIHGDEGEALQLYKGPFSYPINEYLRTGVAHDESGALIKGKGEAFLTDLITNLSKGINKNVVPEDIKVTRFMGEVDDLKGLKQGDTYVEKGFLSTSIRPYLIKDTVEQGWKASILVPQGTNGLFVEGIRGAKKLGNESELLMDKGHTLKILSINQKLKTVNFKLVEIKDNHLPGDIVIPKEVKTDYRDILRQIPSDVNLRFVYDPNLFTSKHSFIEDGVYHVQVITKHDLNRIEEVVQEKHPGFKFSLNEKPKLPKLPDTTKRLKVPKGYTNLKNAEEAGDWEEAWRDSLDEFLSETYIKQGVTNRELEEVNNYRFLTGYKEINGALLDKTKMTTDIEERIGTLDSVIAKVTLPENMILHTGVRDSKIDELNVGDIWSKQTFLSTSADEQVARRYRDQDLKKGKDAWFVDIIAPKSTHGIYTDAAADHVSMSTFGESEFLLQRNQEFKVISKDEVNKTMVVKVHEKEPPKVVGIDEKQIEKEFAKDRKRFYDDLKAEEKEREAYRAAEKKGLPAPPPPVFATGIKLTKADEKWAHTFSIDSSFWKSPSLKHEIGAFLDDYGNIKAFAKGDAHHVGLPKGSFIGGDNLGYVYMHYHPRDVAPSPDDFANYVDLHASGVRLPTLIMTDTKMYTLGFKKDGSPLNAMFIQKEIADIQKEWQDTLRSAKARAINDEHFKRLQSEASEKLAEKLAKLHNIELKITDRDDWWAENEMGKLIPKGYAKKETKEKIEDKVKLPKYYDKENSVPLKAEDLPIVNSKTAAEWSQHSKKINHETAIGLDKDGKIIYYVNGDKSVVSTDPNMFLEASPIKAHIHSHPSSHGPSAPDVWEGMRHDITMDNEANFVSKGIHTMVVTDGYIYDLHVTDPVKFRNRQADAGNLLESLSTGIGMRARDYIREDLSSDIFLENARRTVMRNSKYSEFTESIGRSTFWKADDMEKKYPTIYGEFKRDVRAEIDKEARGIYGGLYHEVLNNRGKNWGFKCDVYPRDTDPVDILRGNAKRLIPKKVWSKTGEEVERFE